MNKCALSNTRQCLTHLSGTQPQPWRWLLLTGCIMLLWSCKKEADDITPQTTLGAENEVVNDWILKKMQDLYYWNEKIPANPDKTQNPSDFFESILYKYDATVNPNGDRFSLIRENAEKLEASLSGETNTTGMKYGLFLRSSGSEDVFAQIFYVLPGSPAQKAGIKRGDIISKVNGQSLNLSNYKNLLFTGTTFTFGFETVSGSMLVATDITKTVMPTVFQENPVFLDSIYTVGSKKVGYLIYNQFVPGVNNSKANEYDAQVDAIFGGFKEKGVNELVLDLRYNSGGYTSSSANLASLVGKGVNSSKLYFREEWNATITPALKKEYGDSFFVQNFLDKAQNIGNSISRVFVLTTDHTASASELIINGLRPYMAVTTIGTTTSGKNFGSITITDDTGHIKWGIEPIVFKSFNSAGQSDYSTGFTPNVEVKEPLSLLPLGDTNEALLNAALSQISGSKFGGRRGVSKQNSLLYLGSSIQYKEGGGARVVKTMKTLH